MYNYTYSITVGLDCYLVYYTCRRLIWSAWSFLSGTDHPIAHLYDVATFQCYLSSSLQDNHLGGAINQVIKIEVASINLLVKGLYCRVDHTFCL